MQLSKKCPEKLPQTAEKKTLVEVLSYHASVKPDHRHACWYNAKGNMVDSSTYAQLWNSAGAVEQLLKQKGLQPGDRVMISYPPGLSFLAGFFGCLRAGVIPCSVYPPNPQKKKAKHSFKQFNNQTADAGAKYALTTTTYKRLMIGASLRGHKTEVKWLATDKLRPVVNSAYHESQTSDIAFIQYTSGSTSTPKGVVISHGAVMHNLAAIASVCYASHQEVESYSTVSWLPQYHDYGLVAVFLMSIFSVKNKALAFSPIDFIKNPLLWADLLEKVDATHTAGPNFSYALLSKRMKANKRVLSCPNLLRANIAAEPIAPTTFSLMEEIGIPRAAINPCYGMAECCAYASAIMGDDIVVHDGVVSVAIVERSAAQGFRFVIAESTTKEVLDDGLEGEICLSTKSAASGYWGKPELQNIFTALNIDGRNYIATGDIGRIVDGRLFVSGRLKELIIVNGKNIYPTDLERTLESEFSSIIRPGSTVAFQHTETSAGIVLEIRDSASNMATLDPETVQSIIREVHDVDVTRIFFLRQGEVPKTTSGKLRRVETKQRSNSDGWESKGVLQNWSPHGPGLSASSPSKAPAEASPDPPDFDGVVSFSLGATVDASQTWEQLGLSSMASVQLRDALEDSFHIILPTDCFERYPTPAALRSYVDCGSGTPLEVNLPKLATASSSKISRGLMTSLQAVGVVLLLLLFSINIIPAWHLSQWLLNDETAVSFQVGTRWLRWMWVPFSVPTFLLSFSFSVVAAKWLVVGRYRESEIPVQSFAYLRWWWVDRAVNMWEFWAGRFMQDTIFLWFFFRLFGAKIHLTAKLSVMVREFDLVEIGENAEVKHPVQCKRFSSWDEDDELCIRLRPVKVGNNSIVAGLVGPGSVVGDGARVERCSAVPEGGIVPQSTVAKGRPAFNAGTNRGSTTTSFSWKLECLKMLWFGFELYNFFALLLVAQLMYFDRLPRDWRYTRLCYWFLYIATSSILVVVECIVLKWVLIGKRRPGPASDSVWRKAALWAVDFHFIATGSLLLSVTANSSLLWNSFFKLMGMDIDFHSKVPPASFPPSIIDLVKVENSSISTVTFDVKKEGILHATSIVDSSVGFKTHVGTGVSLHRTVMPPMTLVEESISREELDERASLYTCSEAATLEVVLLSMYVFMFGAILASLVPAYELWMEVFAPSNVYTAVPVLALDLAVQTTVWMCMLNFLQYLSYGAARPFRREKTSPLVMLYLSYNWAASTWSFLTVLAGTPMFNMVARFLGAKIEGRAIFTGQRIHDWSYITMKDKTIVDGAFVNGHFGVYQEMTLGPTSVSGVLHEGTWVSVGADITAKETGPMSAVLLLSNNNNNNTTEPTTKTIMKTKWLAAVPEHNFDSESPV